jgi:hypothetical protein
MNIAEEHMTLMFKEREKKHIAGRIIRSKTGPDYPPPGEILSIIALTSQKRRSAR